MVEFEFGACHFRDATIRRVQHITLDLLSYDLETLFYDVNATESQVYESQPGHNTRTYGNLQCTQSFQ